jgi:hypothetical protein
MNRRTLLKGFIATAAGVLVADDVLAEPERRIWALDKTMVAPEVPPHFFIDDVGPYPFSSDADFFIRDVPDWVDKLSRTDTPFMNSLHYNYPQRMEFSWGTNTFKKTLKSVDLRYIDADGNYGEQTLSEPFEMSFDDIAVMASFNRPNDLIISKATAHILKEFIDESTLVPLETSEHYRVEPGSAADLAIGRRRGRGDGARGGVRNPMLGRRRNAGSV